MADDEARTGLVDLAVLGNYRLMTFSDLADIPTEPRPGRAALAAVCERLHASTDGDGTEEVCPYVLTVGLGVTVTDNLADLAWVAACHEHEHHGGAEPYRRWEVGADLDRLYANTSTLWAGVDLLASNLGISGATLDAASVMRAAAYRLGHTKHLMAAVAQALDEAPDTPATRAARDALAPLQSVLAPLPPAEDPETAPGYRCEVICPREQAEQIAKTAGVHRVDVDWRCFLAPHSGEQHTVLPDKYGRFYHFTTTGSTP